MALARLCPLIPVKQPSIPVGQRRFRDISAVGLNVFNFFKGLCGAAHGGSGPAIWAGRGTAYNTIIIGS